MSIIPHLGPKTEQQLAVQYFGVPVSGPRQGIKITSKVGVWSYKSGKTTDCRTPDSFLLPKRHFRSLRAASGSDDVQDGFPGFLFFSFGWKQDVW